MVRIPRSHRGGRGSIPRLGSVFLFFTLVFFSVPVKRTGHFPDISIQFEVELTQIII